MKSVLLSCFLMATVAFGQTAPVPVNPLVPGNTYPDSLTERVLLGIDYRQTTAALVHVTAVVPRGPADMVGIKSNDRIMAIGATRISDAKDQSR